MAATKNKKQRWSKEELELLREVSTRDNTYKERMKYFPNRSYSSVRMQCERRGLPSPLGSDKKQFDLNLTNEESAYLAGIIDGEGTITFCKRWNRDSYNPIVSIANTDKDLMEYLHNQIGGTLTVYPHRVPPRRTAYKLEIWQSNVVPILEKVLPYLIVKREQAELMLEYIESRRNRVRVSSPFIEREVEIVGMVRNRNRGIGFQSCVLWPVRCL